MPRLVPIDRMRLRELDAGGFVCSVDNAARCLGVVKAATNYFAGRLSDRLGRKRVLVAWWLVAAPVPFLLIW